MSRAMIVTGDSCGRGGTSSETPPAEFVFGPKTSANEFIVLQEELFRAILENLSLTDQELGVAAGGAHL